MIALNLPTTRHQLPDWTGANCATAPDPDIFFPEPGQDPTPALNYCHGCPLREQCKNYADTLHTVGIWGGTTDDTRPPRTYPDCGTPAAFQRHHRNQQKACDPCRVAWNAYKRERAAIRRAQKGDTAA